MHRTQILLEDRQYAALKAWGRSADKGLAELIRMAIDRMLETANKRKGASRLKEICGIGLDAGGASGREHDKYLYGNSK